MRTCVHTTTQNPRRARAIAREWESSVGSSLTGPASFHPMLSAITNAGLICLERKLRGRSGFDIYGRDNLYLMMMRGNGNVAYGMLCDILDLRCD